MTEIISILENNNCYKSGKKMKNIKGVMVHDTATPGATPEAFVYSWNVPRPNGASVCVHAFCDNSKVINTLPYDMRAWGCGSGSKGSGNDNYIQIEMCVPKEVYFEDSWEYRTRNKGLADKYVKDTVEVLIDWIVERLMELNIKEVTPLNVTSHYEAHKLGIASNHGDPEGFLSLAGLNMDIIRERVQALLDFKYGKTKEDTSLKDDEVGKTNMSVYRIKVVVDALNIRKGPGVSHNKVGMITDRGVYTIVETKGSWGRLKSGAGWICLDYTEKR